jgi:hypothetical protein
MLGPNRRSNTQGKANHMLSKLRLLIKILTSQNVLKQNKIISFFFNSQILLKAMKRNTTGSFSKTKAFLITNLPRSKPQLHVKITDFLPQNSRSLICTANFFFFFWNVAA